MSEDYRVLIVEDTEDIAMLVAISMDHLGLSHYHCKNGKLALEFLETHSPELIVLDIGMPGMNGWEVLTVIRENSKWDNIRVIIATAFNDAANRTVGKLQDVDAYITKPYGPRELKSLVTEILKLEAE